MILVAPCRKNIVRLSIYMIFLIIAMIFCALPNILTEKLQSYRNVRYQTDLKYILLWKPEKETNIALRRKIPKMPTGQDFFIKQKCKHVNCYITYDKNLLKDHWNFDAVVFNVRDIIHLKSNEFNLTRSSNQMYIFRSLDSSVAYPVCDKIFDNFFNWTWTYKLNSDIPDPFFNIYDKSNKMVGPKLFVNWTNNMKHTDRFKYKTKDKSKAVAWLITNCKLKTKYLEFVSELKNELKGYNYTLDTYGSCGDKKCPEENIINCHKIIEKEYYFQLVLEDTLAIDYITEKIGTAMTYITIPIILGVSKYNRFLPPGSFINAQAFDMKKMGAIIDYLIRHPTLYQNFFDWKNHYYYTLRPKRYVCDLCNKLNDNTSMHARKTYSKFRKWWNLDFQNACKGLQSGNSAF